MEERPPLPKTGDPFALLGVDRDASERDLKRAYVRLIKIYRPDRDPEAFQRIQAAYEAATAPAWDIDDMIAPASEELGEPENWPDEPGSGPDEPESWPDEPPEPWQPNPVLDECERLLEAGDLRAVLARTDAIAASVGAIINEGTEHRLARIACALAWINPQEAARIFALAGGDAGASAYHRLHDELLVATSSGLAMWWPAPLYRLLALAPVVDDCRALCRDLYADLYQSPDRYLLTLREISRNPALFAAVLTVLNWADLGDEPQSPPPKGVLPDAIQWINGHLPKYRTFRVRIFFWLFPLLATTNLVGILGAPFLGVVAFAVIIGLWFVIRRGGLWNFSDQQAHLKHVRPWLIDLVLRFHISPDDIAYQIDETQPSSARIARFSDRIRQDRMVDILWRLVSAGRAANEDLDAPRTVIPCAP